MQKVFGKQKNGTAFMNKVEMNLSITKINFKTFDRHLLV